MGSYSFTRSPEAAELSIDDLMPSDGISEVRHGLGCVVDVRRERDLGTPDVAGRRSFEAGQRGPFPCQRRRDGKLDGLTTAAHPRDRQRKVLG
jgi:hypothetical protein